MTRPEVKQILELLIKLYPGFRANDKEITDLWCSCLEDTELEVAKQNVANHAKHSQYRPTIAEVRGISKPKIMQNGSDTVSPAYIASGGYKTFLIEELEDRYEN